MTDIRNTPTAPTTKSPSDQRELVTFVIGETEFGLDIHAVQEIVRRPRLTPVPRAPGYVRGLANLRGNVLPVVDLRTRFGASSPPDGENSRLLVVEVDGVSTGMIVDAVREVLHVDSSAIEMAPPTVRGIDSRFLQGVVTLDQGRRMVLLINQDEAVGAGLHPSESHQNAVAERLRPGDRSVAETTASAVTVQLVTFWLAGEEYGFPLSDVQEIIRVPEVTAIPNAPAAFEGITSLRGRVLPVLDLRAVFGFQPHTDHMATLATPLRDAEHAHTRWVEELDQAVINRTKFTGALDDTQCEFGRWINSSASNDRLLQRILPGIHKLHLQLHTGGKQVVECLERQDPTRAASIFKRSVRPLHAIIERLLHQCLTQLENRDDQRCLVVRVEDTAIALKVDAVNEVLQVERAAIEPAPEIITGDNQDQSHIRGVAKLDDGQRLVITLDAHQLVAPSALAAIKQSLEREAVPEDEQIGAIAMTEHSDNDERQLVSFRVAGEEFATDIMQVQEIIRLEKVTSVPHAPPFVEGVVNLRGSVLPVIDLRRRFGLPERQHDDATRVVVVDVDHHKTGIIVDSVSEVMRLPVQAIEPAPEIVKADYREDFLEGVGKLDGGDRMILILRTDRLLSETELATIDQTTRANSVPDSEQAASSPTPVAPAAVPMAELSATTAVSS